MGKATRDSKVQILEAGNIYFVYRPKVQQDDVDDLDDVQRFHIVLKPDGHKTYRILTTGKKQLPRAEKHGEQTWGFVDGVKHDAKKLEESLREQHYQTKTRGERVEPAARPAGEGVYELVRHGDHTHLVYALELPEKPGDAQAGLHVASEGSYILQVKNPEKGASKGVGLSEKEKAELPKTLQNTFDGRRFTSEQVPDFLQHEGTEILLIAASENISKELGVELEPDTESEQTAEIMRDLHMRKSRHPVAPLFEGEWR